MSEKNEREWLPLELIKTTAEYLGKKGVQSPRLDAEVLLCEVLDCSRVKLYTIFDSPLSAEELSEYREMVRRRAAREPVSRILGKKEFMGLDFIVTEDVLSPRPETEILVEKAIKLLSIKPKKKRSEEVFEKIDKRNVELLKKQIEDNQDLDVPVEVKKYIAAFEQDEIERNQNYSVISSRKILDLGTGSGCIPVSVLCYCDKVTAVAVDISRNALSVAVENAEKAGVKERIKFVESDFFYALGFDEKFDIILSNPPYLVAGDRDIWPEVSGYDPELALYAGGKGLDCYRRIIADVDNYLAPGGWLLLELGVGQAKAVSEIVLQKFPAAEFEMIPDHSGVDRVLAVTSIV